MKKRVAVFFGGRSPEHDVSIETGLQALKALDQQKFDGFPVYVAPDGGWWIGDPLRSRDTYIPQGETTPGLEPVTLLGGPNLNGGGRLLVKGRGLFAKDRVVAFDVALLAFHGTNGEDGAFQGLLEVANIAYTGPRIMAAGVLMDKAATKRMLTGTGIPLLPSITVERPASGLFVDKEDLARRLAGMAFPVIAKPLHLGSSIGVARAADMEELRGTLSFIFRLDTAAIVEPFVENLVEYNVSVADFGAGVTTSAIERPKKTEEILSFKTKYQGGDGKAGAKKTGGGGMLSLAREIHPDIPPGMDADIRRWATDCYRTIGMTGAPRIDFLCNGRTGEIWLNEVNPIPGSFAYYLWEAAEKPLLFSELLTALIAEAEGLHRARQLPADPTHADARLFKRR